MELSIPPLDAGEVRRGEHLLIPTSILPEQGGIFLPSVLSKTLLQMKAILLTMAIG
jgi:hypothetical protein